MVRLIGEYSICNAAMGCTAWARRMVAAEEPGRVSPDAEFTELAWVRLDAARKLALAPGAQVVYIERLRYLGDLPLSLDLTYLVPDIGDLVVEHPLESNDVFTLIEQVSGQRLGSATLALEAISADPHSAATLAVPDGAALLMLERLTSLGDGRPVDLEYIRMRGDRITMRGNLFRN